MTEIPGTEVQARPPSAAWLRILARLYDPSLWLGEIAGMRGRRRTLLAGASGRVVEIGAGTGLNVDHYPDGVAELVLVEPEPAMRRRLERRLHRHGARRADPGCACGAPTPARCVGGHGRLDLVPALSTSPNARSARSHACCARMGSCCSSNTCAPARGSSRRARTTCSSRGAASPAVAVATAPLSSSCAPAASLSQPDNVVWRGMPLSSARSWWDGRRGELDGRPR